LTNKKNIATVNEEKQINFYFVWMLLYSTLAWLILIIILQILSVNFYRLILLINLDEASFYFVEDVGGRPYKRPLYVLLIFGRGFHVKHLVVPGKFKGFVPGDCSLFRHVSLVADQDKNYVFVWVVPDIFYPTAYTTECFLPGEIENN